VTADGETAIVWDAVTGKRVAELQLEGQDIAGASFSPDGQFIVTIPALSRAAHLWRTDSWQLLKQLGTHDDWFEAAVFSPDGSRVATGSYDGISRIWDVSTGKVLKEFSEHHSQVRGVAFDPSGSTIATASYDTMARISDVATGAVITEISEQQPLHSISFSPDGRFVVSTSNIVRIWEPGTGNTILELGGFGNDVLSATFSPNGRLIVVGDGPTAGVYQCIVCAQRNELPALATARLSRSLTGEERKKFLHER
jgi:WD40 repeat protein